MTQGIAFTGTAFDGLSAVVGGQTSVGGLQGLFSGLVESAVPGVPVLPTAGVAVVATAQTPDVAALLTGAPAGGDAQAHADALAALQALLHQAGLRVSSDAPSDKVKIEGAAQADPLEALAAALQQVQKVLGDAGITPEQLATPEGLQKALQALGVPADKVEGLASTIENVLDELKKKLGAAQLVGAEQVNVLAQVVVAAAVLPHVKDAAGAPLLASKQPVAFTIGLVADEQVDSAVYTQAGKALKSAASVPGAADVARDLVGLKDESKEVAAEVVDEAPVVAKAVTDAVLPAVAITVDPVGVTVKDVAKASTPVAPVNVASHINATQALNAADVAAPASGEVKFVWKGEEHAKPVISEADKPKLDAEAKHADALLNRAGVDAQVQAATQTDAVEVDFAQQLDRYQQKLDLAKRYDVVGQAAVQVKNLIDQGGGEIRVRLNPPELGQIHIDLVVKDGAVSGKISATDPAVVNALASDVKQFGDGLKQAGFKLGGEGLSFMLSQQNQQNPQQQQNQQGAHNNAGGALWANDGTGDDIEVAAAANAAIWVAPDRLIDVNI